MQRAMDFVKKAREEERNTNHSEAYRRYINADDYFMMAMKCRGNLSPDALLSY